MASPLFSRAVGPTRDPSRAGAVWVAGTGAFLLLVASAVFVASNWDDIPPAAKLAAIGLLTGVFLVAGRSLRRTLPGTSGALYHLGAFLIPVDVAALALHLGASAAQLALAEGVVCASALWLLDRTEPSSLLRWGAAASVVVGTAGLGGLLEVPPGLLLAGAAMIALATGAPRAATGWALVAGTAPLAVLAGAASGAQVEWLTTFALGGDRAGWAAGVTGVLAAAVLIVQATRRREAELAVLGMIVAGVGLGTTWWTAAPTADTSLVLLAAAVLGLEGAATLLRRDGFWEPITAPPALVAELVASAATVLSLATILQVALADATDVSLQAPRPSLALALGLTAATWLLADLRRRQDDAQDTLVALITGSGFGPAAPAAAICAVAAVAMVGDPLAVAIALAAVAGVLVSTGRPFSHATAAAALSLAPVAAMSEPGLVAVLGGGGAVLLAWAAALRVETLGPRPTDGEGAWLLAGATCLPVLAGAVVLTGTQPLVAMLVGAIAVLWTAALLLDRGDRDERTRGLGLVPRYASILVLAPAGLEAGELGLLAGVLLALATGEAVRRRNPDIALSSVITLPVLVLATCAALGVGLATSGLVLSAVAPIALIGVIAAPGPVRRVALPLSVVCFVLGGTLTGDDPAAVATWLLMVGGSTLAVGLWQRTPVLGWLGAGLVVLGTETHLSLGGVQASEAYLAPVCILLVAAGIAARRQAARRGEPNIGSWLAYFPAIALFGGAALLERIGGGGPGHASLAGLVGVVAVLIGGWRRLAAPLFAGTALLVGVAGYESLAVTADLPTWVWLAAGGTILLAAGILLERTATSPLEGGRRLVEVIGDRFD